MLDNHPGKQQLMIEISHPKKKKKILFFRIFSKNHPEALYLQSKFLISVSHILLR
jgi:hypothetical protein